MQLELLTWLIPLPPLLAFGLIVLLANRSNKLSHSIAVGAMIISWVLAMTVFWGAITTEDLGHNPISSGKPKDPEDKPGLPPRAGGIEPMYARFFAFISLFAFGMLTLAISDNLLLLFIGWEIMGLCSYLLIGFWYGKESARKAMIREILFSEHVLEALASSPSGVLGLSAAGLIGIFLFLGTVGKSAQWPLHVWLPDAMEGPTPVSAMIHAATMVSAGVYLIVRFFPLISAGWHEGQALNPTMTLIAFIGAFTALFAATIAVAQNDVKRVLAYSTISQLGYMVAAIGIGAYVAAAFHLVTHAFFKALLFLGSGSVIHGMEHGVKHTHEHVESQNMFNMGGLREKMPVTFWTFLIGGFALSGFPILTAGFWSKDEILADAFANEHWAVFIVLALAALLTAFYSMRLITLTFLGKPRTSAAEHAHESVWTMTLPLVILAVFALTFGWLGIPEDFPVIGGLLPNWFHEFVSGSLLEHPEMIHFNPIPLLTSLGVALGGLFVGWRVYRDQKAGEPDPLERPLGSVYNLLKNKYYFDELYDLILVRPAYWFAETFTSRWVDRGIIDGTLHAVGRASLKLGSFLRNAIDLPIINGAADLFSDGVKRFGNGIRIIQTGRVQGYLTVGLFFTSLLLAYFVIFQP